MIHFNVPPITGNEVTYITEAINSHKICGDGNFTKKCNEWFEVELSARKVMLTTSGSTALDMAVPVRQMQLCFVVQSWFLLTYAQIP